MSYPNDLDQNQVWGWMRVDAGPTIGWVHRPMFNNRTVTTGSSTSIGEYDFQILINRAAAFQVLLPLVATWMRNKWGLFPINIKDISGAASVNNITITPAGADLIDGLANLVIAGDYGSATLYPIKDLSGWTQQA